MNVKLWDIPEKKQNVHISKKILTDANVKSTKMENRYMRDDIKII